MWTWGWDPCGRPSLMCNGLALVAAFMCNGLALVVAFMCNGLALVVAFMCNGLAFVAARPCFFTLLHVDSEWYIQNVLWAQLAFLTNGLGGKSQLRCPGTLDDEAPDADLLRVQSIAGRRLQLERP